MHNERGQTRAKGGAEQLRAVCGTVQCHLRGEEGVLGAGLCGPSVTKTLLEEGLASPHDRQLLLETQRGVWVPPSPTLLEAIERMEHFGVFF